LSARFGRLDCVKLLVQQGANVTLKGEQHKTALDWAKEEGKHDVAKYLSNLTVQFQTATQNNKDDEKKER